MTDPRWQRIKEIFAQAAARPAGEREAFLAKACGGDETLRAEVESLLRAHPPTDGAAAPVEPIPEGPGTRIGPYKLLEPIGEGGFGVVFMAEQEAPVRRRVALKVIKLGMDTKQVVARFEQERQALAMMDHPSIARVLDAGATSSGRPYFVMELVRGDPITEYCDREKLPTAERLELFEEVCRAVQHAHQKGIVHRDLKPSNVLVTIVDGRAVPKVIDFGVAKAMHAPLTAKTLFTEFRQMIGTPLYMSPEQAEMSGVDIDTRSDIYSLGVLLYELLTGTTPLTREQLLAAGWEGMRQLIRDVDPAKPSTRVATMGAAGTTVAQRRGTVARRLGLLLRGDLDWIVMKCLEKDRTRRYDTAVGLARDLERHLGGEAVEAAPPSAAYRVAKFVRRNRGPVAATAAVVVTALGLLSWIAWERTGRARDAEAFAQEKSLLASSERAAREQADARTKDATTARDRAEREAYLTNIASADAAFRSNEIATVRQRLDACPEALRNWEWRYLDAQCDTSLVVLRGHQGAVFAAAFSPDGTRVVTGGTDGTARLWDVASGREMAVLRGHEGSVGACAFSPDGTQVVTSANDKTARIWDVQSGREVNALRGHEGSVRSCPFSPDGSRILTASDDGTARIWDAARGIESAVLRGHERVVTSAAFGPDGTKILTSSADGTARIWDAATSSELAVLRGHTSLVRAAFNADGSRIVTASWDSTARLWNASTGEELAALLGHRYGVNAASFHRNGSKVITASNDGTARLWDAVSGQEVAVLRGHEGTVWSASFSPDGMRVVTASSDATARLWDSVSQTVIAVLRGHEEEVRSAVFSPDGAYVLTASFDGTARIWDGRVSSSMDQGLQHPLDVVVLCATFDSSGRRIVTGSNDGRVRFWDAETGSSLATLRGHEDGVCDVAFSPDGTRVVSASWDSTFRIWRNVSATPSVVLGEHQAEVYSATFSPNGSRVLTSSDDGTVRLWDGTTGAALSFLRGPGGPIHQARFGPNSARIVTACSDGTARIQDLATGAEIRAFRGRMGEINSAILSADGSRVAAASSNGTVWIWDAETAQELATLRGHTGTVYGVEFSPDGSRVLTASEDQSVRLWDSTTGKEVLALRDHQGEVNTARFSPDGSSIVTASDDGTARIWSSIPYRDRWPPVHAARSAVARMRPRLVRACESDAPLDPIAESMLGDPSLSPVERTAAAIVLEEAREARRREAQECHDYAVSVLSPAGAPQDSLPYALERAQRAEALIPGDPDHAQVVGMGLYRLGRFDEALAALERAEEGHRNWDHECVAVWAFLAMTNARLGRRDAAGAALARATDLADVLDPHRHSVAGRLLPETRAVLAAAFPAPPTPPK